MCIFFLEPILNYVFLNNSANSENINFFFDGLLPTFLFSIMLKSRVSRESFDETSIAPKIYKEVMELGGVISLIGGSTA
jgi:hypothetical protein